MEQTPLQAQQAAIQEVRARYERGELSFEDFRRALDALVLAEDAEECQAILHALPASFHSTALAALATPAPPAVSAPLAETRRKRIVAFMGQVKKLSRAWKLASDTHTVAFMGEVQLDLNLADMPPQTKMQVTVIMGTVIIYVPPSARVLVRSTVLLGEANALGENTNGVVAFGHEQHDPSGTAPKADIEIEAFVLMGNVKVVLAEKPPVSISEMVRTALRAAALGMQRGLQAPAPQASLDAPQGQPQLPRAPEPPRRDA
ncbi:MAG TPA: LiaF domain-containing protein [Ktedonobacterales bacterium]|nr:LiaF domain-containing protein [Ktedonobacterales bacterium]